MPTFTVTVDSKFRLVCATREEARSWALFYASMGYSSVTVVV